MIKCNKLFPIKFNLLVCYTYELTIQIGDQFFKIISTLGINIKCLEFI